jgi:response regulator receiver domain-containing protein
LRDWRNCVEPDLIVSDLKMPNMSGFDFLSIARRRFPQIPTIAVSGEFYPPVEPLGVLADAFFAKPFRFEELLAKIRDSLCEGPPRPAIKRDRAPVWVPRNGDYYVITCTDCLRSFSIPAEKNIRVLRELRKLECIFCDAPVQFIVEEMPEAAGLPTIESESHWLSRVDWFNQSSFTARLRLDATPFLLPDSYLAASSPAGAVPARACSCFVICL